MKKHLKILILFLLFGCSDESQKEERIVNKSSSSLSSDITTIDGCVFETNMEKECWTRIGIYPIDSVAESYACQLIDMQSNSILVAKYIGDNGAFPNESAYVLWTESNKEFVKEFYAEESLEVHEKPKRELKWKSLRRIIDSLRLDTVITMPQLKTEVSHNIGFAVQYFEQDIFFCERLQDNEWKSAIDKNHPKVLFWMKLTDLLKPTTARLNDSTIAR